MEKSGFFNSVNGDRKYGADFFARYFASFIGNGIFPNPSTGLQATSNEDMTITVKAGQGWINGYYYNNDSDLILEISTADGVLNRIDRIVLQYNTVNREIKAVVKKGTFASSPVAPTLQRDVDMYELGIADITINAGAVSISQANITDLRLNNELCGIVHGIIDQVDTTTIFNQYLEWYTQTIGQAETDISNIKTQLESDFNIWFATIQGLLSGDAAGNLLNQINNLAGTGRTSETVKKNADDIASLALETAQKVPQADYTKIIPYVLTTGSANTYTITLSPAPLEYIEGMAVCIKVNADSTGISTINVNELGAKGLKNIDGTDITNLREGNIYTFRYNGTYFVLQGAANSGGSDIEVRKAILDLQKKLDEQNMIDFVNKTGIGFYDTFEDSSYIDVDNTSAVYDKTNESVRFSSKDLPTVSALGHYTDTNIIDVDQPMYVGDKINGINVTDVTNGNVNTAKDFTSAPPIVSASTYTISNYARPQFLANGWIVETELRSGLGVYFRVSKDFGATYSELCFLGSTTITAVSVTSKNTTMYIVVEDGTEVWGYSFDALTVNDEDIKSISNPVRIDYSQTTFGSGIHLIITPTNRLVVAYSSKNVISTYLGIKLAYSDDLGLTWNTPVQLVTSNTSAYLNTCPWLVYKSNGLISLVYSYSQSTAYKQVICVNINSTLNGIDTSIIIHDNLTKSAGYDQFNPMVMRISNGEYVGRLVCVWYGFIGTAYYHVKLSYSDDNGLTWSNPTDLTSADTALHNANPTITQDGSGKVYIVWSGSYSGTQIYRIKYMTTETCITFTPMEYLTSNETLTHKMPVAMEQIFTGSLPFYIWQDNEVGVIRASGNLTFNAVTSQITLDSAISVTTGQKLKLARTIKLVMKNQTFDTFTTLDLNVYSKINKTTAKNAVSNSTSVVTTTTDRELRVADKLFMNGILNEITNLTPNFDTYSRSTDVITSANSIFDNAKPQVMENGWIIATTYDRTNNKAVFQVSKDNGATWSTLTEWVATLGSANTDMAVCSKGNMIYAVIKRSSDVLFSKFDVTTVQSQITTFSTVFTYSAGGSICIDISDSGVIGIAMDKVANISFTKSIDGGTSWTSMAGVAGAEYLGAAASTGRYGTTFKFNKLGNPCISSLKYYSSGASYLQVSVWNGSSWTNDINLETFTGGYFEVSYPYSLAKVLVQKHGPNVGRIWVACAGSFSSEYPNRNIYVYYSDDNGFTWSEKIGVTVGDTYNQLQPSFAEDDLGNVYVVWKGYTINNPTKYNLRMCVFNGSTWSDITELTQQSFDDLTVPVCCDNYHNFTTPLIMHKDSYKVDFLGEFSTLAGYDLTLQNAVSLSEGIDIYIQDYTAKNGETDLTLASIDEEKYTFTLSNTSATVASIKIASNEETNINSIAYAIQ